MHCLVIVRNFLNVVTFCAAWADCWLYWHSQNKTKHPCTGHMTLTYIQWPSLNRGNKYHTWVRDFRQMLPSKRNAYWIIMTFGALTSCLFIHLFNYFGYNNWKTRFTKTALVPPRKSIETIFYASSHFKLTIFSQFTALIIRQVYQFISIPILGIDQHLI